ncbi:MAG TPA: efflux RND transporter periplasmic adaptor subunit [Candidatus Polarisedimenticolia bacterium]|jgi:membrane fusion protein (multidrug efflux system)|nr:efflux RND transporter periplasmic adaptor subunit [Candidatus Polarisedimenticolia bacterium]
MKKRMLMMLLAVFVLLAGLGFAKYSQIRKAMAAGAAWQQPPEAVTTVVAKSTQWDRAVTAIGSIVAVHGVSMSADLPGVVEKITFESGQKVREGDLLVNLDTRQETAQLASARAKLQLAEYDLVRIKGLHEQGIVPQADLDSAEATEQQAKAGTAEIEATIARKTIRAPFSGVLGIRQINLGQYLKAGDPIVSLQSLDPIYAHFSVPQQQVPQVHVGSDVRVGAEGLTQDITGKVTAIDATADPDTRNVQIQATLANPGHLLRPGMFARASVLLPEKSEVVPLPSSSVLYAPYGDTVFIVETMQGKDGKDYKGVRQQVVKLGPSHGDQVAILSGVKPGEEVVTSGVFKLRNGAAVLVNNEVQPQNNPEPHPEES